MTSAGHRPTSVVLVAVALTVAGVLLAAPGAFASAYRVSSSADHGIGTLASAIIQADANPGEDAIRFDVDTVNLSSRLPWINDPVRIEGPAGDPVEVRRVSSGPFDPRFPILAFFGHATPSYVANLSVSGGAATSASPIGAAGGIYNQEANLSLQRVTVHDNQGTGIVNTGRLSLDFSTVRGNSLQINASTAAATGGGIRNLGIAVIDHSSIEGNSVQADSSGFDGFASASGGGIANVGGSGATLSLQRSTVSGNTAEAIGDDTTDATGGGITNDAPASMRLNRVTVSENQARISSGTDGDAAGGGIEVSDHVGSGPLEDVTIGGSTVVANAVRADGGGALGANVDVPWTFHPPEVTFGSTIVASPDPESAGNCAGAPGIASAGYNLEGGDSCGFDQATDILNESPRVGPLARNGGPTRTRALLLGSPAIDKGHSFGSTTDQRGQSRPLDFESIDNAIKGDGSDIGAFEVQPPPDTIITQAVKQTSEPHVSIYFVSPSAGSTFVCTLDGEPVGPCTSPFETPRLDVGSHTFTVRAIDPSGAEDETPAEWKFEIVKQ